MNKILWLITLLLLSSCNGKDPVVVNCPLVIDYLGDFSVINDDGVVDPRLLYLSLSYDGNGFLSIDHFKPEYLSEDSISGVINLVTDINRNACRYYEGPIKIHGKYSTTMFNNCVFFEFEGAHEYIIGSGCIVQEDTSSSYHETIRSGSFTIKPYKLP